LDFHTVAKGRRELIGGNIHAKGVREKGDDKRPWKKSPKIVSEIRERFAQKELPIISVDTKKKAIPYGIKGQNMGSTLEI
jgi:hypothetical protein